MEAEEWIGKKGIAAKGKKCAERGEVKSVRFVEPIPDEQEEIPDQVGDDDEVLRRLFLILLDLLRSQELKIQVINQGLNLVVQRGVKKAGGTEEGDGVFLDRFSCRLRLVADESVGDINVCLPLLPFWKPRNKVHSLQSKSPHTSPPPSRPYRLPSPSCRYARLYHHTSSQVSFLLLWPI